MNTLYCERIEQAAILTPDGNWCTGFCVAGEEERKTVKVVCEHGVPRLCMRVIKTEAAVVDCDLGLGVSYGKTD